MLTARRQICRETFKGLNYAPYVIPDTLEGYVSKMAESRVEKLFCVLELAKTSSVIVIEEFPYIFRKRTIL